MNDETPTNEELSDWIFKVEEIAVTDRDLGFATRLVLLNLIKRLSPLGIIDTDKFISDLHAAMASPEMHEGERLACRVFFSEIEHALRESQGPMRPRADH